MLFRLVAINQDPTGQAILIQPLLIQMVLAHDIGLKVQTTLPCFAVEADGLNPLSGGGRNQYQFRRIPLRELLAVEIGVVSSDHDVYLVEQSCSSCCLMVKLGYEGVKEIQVSEKW